MSVVSCPFCSNPVTLPDPWTGPAYTCPHCRRVVSTAPPAPARKPAPASNALNFDDEDDEMPSRPARRTPSGSPGGTSWLTIFTATLAANVLAGVILLLGVRLYIHWSIQDAFDKAKETPAKAR